MRAGEETDRWTDKTSADVTAKNFEVWSQRMAVHDSRHSKRDMKEYSSQRFPVAPTQFAVIGLQLSAHDIAIFLAFFV
jgi:hypothetical protein